MFKRCIPSFARHAVAAALLIAAGAAVATDFKYWYLDDGGFFQGGDLSLGNAKLTPPAWACGRRFFQGALLSWIGEFGNVLDALDTNNAVNVHVNGQAGGCKPKPLVEHHPGGLPIAPALGTHYLRIDPDAGGHWFDKDGKWPVCNCALPASYTTMVDDIRWSALDAAFKAQLDRAEASNGHERWILIESMTAPLVRLQTSVTAEIGRRRLMPAIALIDGSVRALEDLALSSLNKAGERLESCRLAQGAGAFGEAYKACSMAQQSVALAQTALRVVRDEVRP